MLTLVTVFHLLFALSLIGLVLIQDPKDGAMGVFGAGGSSNSFFGSTGATSFLAKTTRWAAILFAAGCMVLAYMNTHKGSSVMDQFPVAPTTVPATTPAAEPQQTAPAEEPATESQPAK